jgi:hypothetical protein
LRSKEKKPAWAEGVTTRATKNQAATKAAAKRRDVPGRMRKHVADMTTVYSLSGRMERPETCPS